VGRNRTLSGCLKNAVMFVLCNGEYTFLKEVVNIHVLLLNNVFEALTVCMEDE
jgi:hypothetical protein